MYYEHLLQYIFQHKALKLFLMTSPATFTLQNLVVTLTLLAQDC